MNLFKKHPSIIMFLISVLVFGITIGIGFVYQWHWSSIIAIVLAVIAMGVLLFSMLYDFHLSSSKPTADNAKVFKAEDAPVKKGTEKDHENDEDW